VLIRRTKRNKINLLIFERTKKSMGFINARSNFETAKNSSTDQVIKKLADGLIELSRGIESALKEIKEQGNSRS
jgi:hypothetical protein